MRMEHKNTNMLSYYILKLFYGLNVMVIQIKVDIILLYSILFCLSCLNFT